MGTPLSEWELVAKVVGIHHCLESSLFLVGWGSLQASFSSLLNLSGSSYPQLMSEKRGKEKERGRKGGKCVCVSVHMNQCALEIP